MGTRRKPYRRRSDVKLPKSLPANVRQMEGEYRVPWAEVPFIKKGPWGDPIPKGTRLRKWGLTPEERLMWLAPTGTSPERLMFGWLMKNKFRFAYQQPYLGGRVPGGMIVDFVLYDFPQPVCIRIMSYWHQAPETRARDELQKYALEGLGAVVWDVWEHEIQTVEGLEMKMAEILYGHAWSGS